jgi:sec-independent protein translocase protein TatB
MFGISGGEFITLVVLALILIGPDRLPTVSRDAARIIVKFRGYLQNFTNEMKSNLGPGFEDLKPEDLHPKKFIQKQLAQAIEEADQAPKNARIDPDLL